MTDRIYFFHGDAYTRWTLGQGIDVGYPRNIVQYWHPWMNGGIDAVVPWKKGELLIFKGGEYMRWFNRLGPTPDYPKPILPDWGPFLASGVDATLYRVRTESIQLPNGRSAVRRIPSVYFFVGNEYARWTIGSNSMDPNYPRTIAAHWDSSIANGVDAAFYIERRDTQTVPGTSTTRTVKVPTAYFFVGDSYVRWTLGKGRDSGYPKKIATEWPGLWSSNIDAAVVRPWGRRRLRFLVVPHEGDSNSARLWIGLHNYVLPQKSFVLELIQNGQTVRTLRLNKWKSMGATGLLSGHFHWVNLSRLASDVRYDVRLIDPTNSAVVGEASFDTLPTSLPQGGRGTRPFTVLLGSCHHYKQGASWLKKTVKSIKASVAQRPYLKFLVGDQVYIDVPVADLTVPSGVVAAGAAVASLVTGGGVSPRDINVKARIQGHYRQSWEQEGFKALLATGGAYFTTDDHEYWNNYPHVPLHLRRLNDRRFRDKWKAWARHYRDRYQRISRATQIDIGQDLSFFVADTRADRNKGTRFMSTVNFKKLKSWITGLASPGVLIIGQPLIAETPGKVSTDANLPFFDQYDDLVQKIVQSNHDIVVLTGDVHYGRIATVQLDSTKGTKLIEVISSPMSLVRGPGTKIWSARSVWRLGQDVAPRLFPWPGVAGITPRSISYDAAVSATSRDRKRAEENLMTIAFTRTAVSGQVKMKVTAWKIRHAAVDFTKQYLLQ